MTTRPVLFFFHSVVDALGAAGTTTYLSVFNPPSSGRVMGSLLTDYQCYSTALTDTAASLTIWRISAASGGTLLSSSYVNRFDTLHPDPVCEVRTGNPAITVTGAPLRGFAPAITGPLGGVVSSATVPPMGTSFLCRPGEGLAFRTGDGDSHVRWNITYVWSEAG